MTITIASQKGGVGKSTTATAIATGTNLKALTVDLDAQGNTTFMMRGNALDKNAYDLITGQATPGEVIQHTAAGDIIPAGEELAAADTTLKGRQRIFGLSDALKSVKKDYDVIVIDTPPSLGTLLVNALVASDSVIIPVQADILSLQGLFQLVDTIDQVRDEYNPGLKMAGIVFTRHTSRTILSRELADTITEQAKAKGIPVLDVFIPESVAVKEAQLARQSIFVYAPRSKPAQAYRELLEKLDLV